MRLHTKAGVPVVRIETWHYVVLVVSLIVFSAICSLVMVESNLLMTMDRGVSQLMQGLADYFISVNLESFFRKLMLFFSFFGEAKVIILLTLGLCGVAVYRRRYLLAVWFLMVVSTGGLFGKLIKAVVQRQRPVGHLAIDSGYSFPSGHAVASTLFVFVLLMVFVPKVHHTYLRRFLTVGISIVYVGILVSRLYLNAHYLSDVAGGICLGLIWVFGGLMVYDAMQKSRFIEEFGYKRKH